MLLCLETSQSGLVGAVLTIIVQTGILLQLGYRLLQDLADNLHPLCIHIHPLDVHEQGWHPLLQSTNEILLRSLPEHVTYLSISL